jgi:hypothetical protein
LVVDTASNDQNEQSNRGFEANDNNMTRHNFMKMIRIMNSTNKSNAFRMTFGTTGMQPNEKKTIF